MSWEERIAGAASYTPPSGGEAIVFDYDNFSATVDKRTTSFQFPGVDGSLIQDLGRSGRKCPVTAIFHGPDCDLEASAFEKALYERGIGRLNHPVYGDLNVVPFGAVQRRDNLQTRANVVTVQVTFWEVISSITIATEENPRTATEKAIRTSNDAGQQGLVEYIKVFSIEELVSLQNSVAALVNDLNKLIRPIANTVESIVRTYDAIEQSILRGIDTVVGTPLALAAQIQALIQAPARAVELIQTKLDGYGNLFDSLLGANAGEPFEPGLNNVHSNDFHTLDMAAGAVLSAIALSALNSTFETAPQAITTADFLLTKFGEYTDWRDKNFESLEQIDTGEAFQGVQEMVSIASAFLIETSFSSAQERVMVTNRPRTLIDLCAELYGEVDERLDFFIRSNSLNGTEIIEIPADREILYYV